MNKHSHTLLVGVVLGLFCLSLTLFHKSFKKRGRGVAVHSSQEASTDQEVKFESSSELPTKQTILRDKDSKKLESESPQVFPPTSFLELQMQSSTLRT